MPPRKKKVAKADPFTATFEEVADAAQGWSNAVLKCRLLGHSWDQYHSEHITRFRYWHVQFRCERKCGVEKWEEWTERGLVTAKGMNYPRDENGKPLYLLEGTGRVNTDGRGALRLESVSRTKYIEIEGGPDDDLENMPRSSKTINKLKENKQWPLN